jgi:hypothetical protein
MKLVICTSLALCLLGTAAVAGADPTEPGTVQVPPVKIVGRVMRPLASVEVNRLVPDLRPREPRGSFADATEGAVRKDPF